MRVLASLLALVPLSLTGCGKKADPALRAPAAPPAAAAPAPPRATAPAPPPAASPVVTLRGQARDAKGGAVVVAGDQVVYLEGVDSWPDEVHGRQVQVSGRLVRKKYLPDPGPPDEPRQGAVGLQDVLEEPTWQLAP